MISRCLAITNVMSNDNVYYNLIIQKRKFKKLKKKEILENGEARCVDF